MQTQRSDQQLSSDAILERACRGSLVGTLRLPADEQTAAVAIRLLDQRGEEIAVAIEGGQADGLPQSGAGQAELHFELDGVAYAVRALISGRDPQVGLLALRRAGPVRRIDARRRARISLIDVPLYTMLRHCGGAIDTWRIRVTNFTQRGFGGVGPLPERYTPQIHDLFDACFELPDEHSELTVSSQLVHCRVIPDVRRISAGWRLIVRPGDTEVANTLRRLEHFIERAASQRGSLPVAGRGT